MAINYNERDCISEEATLISINVWLYLSSFNSRVYVWNNKNNIKDNVSAYKMYILIYLFIFFFEKSISPFKRNCFFKIKESVR